MYMTTSMQSPAVKAAEGLVERYRARLRSVEQLGDNTVRGRLNDGRAVTAMAVSEGGVAVWEVEDAC